MRRLTAGLYPAQKRQETYRVWRIANAPTGVGMRCLTCGVEVVEGRLYCDRCAAFAGGAPTASGASDALSKIVPYRNKPALIGYYLAVFSFIPCIGLPLAIAAVVLGVRGLAVVRETPEAHGKAHAWVAIVLGGLMLVLQAACGVLFVLALRAPS
ncbi:MAG: hypothetical protein K6U77_11770 [Armatimonadetes bacterium]|nr:hypothetical protein [Armatimonadota bacterium]